MFEGTITPSTPKTIIDNTALNAEAGETYYTIQASGVGVCEIHTRLSKSQPWYKLGEASNGEVKTFRVSGNTALEARAVGGDISLTIKR